MSVLAYPRSNEEEIFRNCTKDCGVVTATEDYQCFALRCIYCSEKFLYFDAFIGHMQTEHLEPDDDDDDQHPNESHQDLTGSASGSGVLGFRVGSPVSLAHIGHLANGSEDFEEIEDLTDAEPGLLEPQLVVKQELQELGSSDEEAISDDDDDDVTMLPQSSILPTSTRLNLPMPPLRPSKSYVNVKNEPLLPDGDSSMDDEDPNYLDDNSGDYADYAGSYNAANSSLNMAGETDFLSYDEMVEESLLGQRDRGLTMHIKDRKMIEFLIDSYKRNPFLWDHSHLQFRDRVKRARFLDWIVLEFKSRFNISLAKDAITRKWDNLRTVYKRECNRMALEKTNISTLWYFKELHFLNEVYSYNAKMTEAVVKEVSYRRRVSGIWNDTSTNKLLSMVKRYQCFYNRFDPDYRSKEKRGEGLQQMAMELQQLIDVSTIQISKRISQLRFDYSKQKMERLNCERIGRKFIPNYLYYEQMGFMDDDVPPFKCQHCSEIVQTLRELDLHMLTHQPTPAGGYYCNVCNIQFHSSGEFDSHKQLHLGGGNEIKYNCDLCTASFREKSNYDEHLRRHNDEPFLTSLTLNHSVMDSSADDLTDGGGIGGVASLLGGENGAGDEDNNALTEMFMPETSKPFPCEVCHRTFATSGHLNAHRIVHQDERERCYKCDYPQCSKSFVSRNSLFEHLKQHYNNEEFKCDICGKTFKSTKNLQNHKQIHDKVKRYVCQICGSAFAQAAGLYLHKRRHNRPSGVGGGNYSNVGSGGGASGSRSNRSSL